MIHVRILLAMSLLLPLSALAQTPEQKQQTIAYLQKLQLPDGGFAPNAQQPKSSVRATSSALRALKYFGGMAKDKEGAARFVQSCFDKASGSFADTPGGKPDVASAAIGFMAVIEAKLPVEPYRDAVVRYLGEHANGFEDIRIAAAGVESLGKAPAQAKEWLMELAKLRNPDGGYGKGDGAARDTGGAAAAVLRLGATLENKDNVLKAMRTGQRADGAFGKSGTTASDLETSYRVLRCFHMLKQKPTNVKGLKAFIAKCRNADGGYGVAPAEASSASGTYFASIITHWLAED